MQLYGIFGAGGFAREVIPVASEMLRVKHNNKKDFELVFVVENLKKASLLNGYRVISSEDFLASQVEDKYFNIAIADHQTRARIAEITQATGINPFSIFAENSVRLDANQIGEGAILCPFTTITSNAKIGKFFHGNIYSYVAHDCIIGDYVTFAPNVHCNGKVIIEDYAYIGTGAVLKQGTEDKPIVIGKNAVVGMGAVVTKSVLPFTTVIGNPAAPLVKKQ